MFHWPLLLCILEEICENTFFESEKVVFGIAKALPRETNVGCV